MKIKVSCLVSQPGFLAVRYKSARLSIPKVFRVLGPPLLIGLSLLLAANSPYDHRSFAAACAEDGDETNDDKKDTSASEAYLPSSEPVREETNRGGQGRKARERRREVVVAVKRNTRVSLLQHEAIYVVLVFNDKDELVRLGRVPNLYGIVIAHGQEEFRVGDK